MPTKGGSVRLFRLFGIDVYLHWAWFLAFLYFVSRPHEYSNYGWSALEVLALFLIVLTHEFGHALACRQVGGQANQIVLWPLGGVAYINAPQRPGAQLWSIVAGPLVNVVLIPILAGLVSASYHLRWYDSHPDVYGLIHQVYGINFVILIFNLMPVYPLDGGQILRSLLWFPFGRANSLFIATIIGLIGATAFAAFLAWEYFHAGTDQGSKEQLIYLGIMAAFILMNCWGGLKQAQALAKIAKIPRRDGFACPSCKSAPPLGALWRCGQCQQPFDTFLSLGTCPHCGLQFNVTQCLDCGVSRPMSEWIVK